MMKFIRFFICSILVSMLASCGEGTTSSPFGTVTTGTTTSSGSPFSNTSDKTINGINMSLSITYNKASDLVSCYVGIVDQDGNFINTMLSDNFQIIAGSVFVPSADRTIGFVSSNANMVGLVLDSSGSMSAGTRLSDAQAASKLFIDTMSGDDMTAIIDFDSTATVTQQLTTSKTDLKTAIDALVADGGTNLGGGISTCAGSLGARPGKTACILLTDGEDGSGLIDEGIAAANLLSIPVYTIFMGDDITDTARADMEKIADETGGTFFEVADVSELTTVFSTTIPAALAARTAGTSYLITFDNIYPADNYISILATVSYENGLGVHYDDFTTQYYVDF